MCHSLSSVARLAMFDSGIAFHRRSNHPVNAGFKCVLLEINCYQCSSTVVRYTSVASVRVSGVVWLWLPVLNAE